MKLNHQAALAMAQQRFTNPFSDDLENLYACYLDARQQLDAIYKEWPGGLEEVESAMRTSKQRMEQLAELRKAAQASLDARDDYDYLLYGKLEQIGELDNLKTSTKATAFTSLAADAVLREVLGRVGE